MYTGILEIFRQDFGLLLAYSSSTPLRKKSLNATTGLQVQVSTTSSDVLELMNFSHCYPQLDFERTTNPLADF